MPVTDNGGWVLDDEPVAPYSTPKKAEESKEEPREADRDS